MLKLSDLHVRHRTLTLSLTLRGFKTAGTRLWFILPPQVMKTLQWPVGQRLRSKVSHTVLVMTPLRQVSALRKPLPRKRTAVDQLRHDLAWQACLKKLKRSVRTKRLVKRQRPRPRAMSMQSSNPTHRDPALSLPTHTSQHLTPVQTASAGEQATSDVVGGEGPLSRLRLWLKRMKTHFLMLLIVLLVLAFYVPMTVYAVRHYFWDEPVVPKAVLVQNAGRVISVSLSGGFLARSLVETDLGYYALMDGISLARNEALTLETREGKARFLCDSQHRCLRLMADEQDR